MRPSSYPAPEVEEATCARTDEAGAGRCEAFKAHLVVGTAICSEALLECRERLDTAEFAEMDTSTFGRRRLLDQLCEEKAVGIRASRQGVVAMTAPVVRLRSVEQH